MKEKDFWSEKEKELKDEEKELCYQHYSLSQLVNTREGREQLQRTEVRLKEIKIEKECLHECRSVRDAEIKEIVKVLDDVLITNIDMCPKENENKLLSLKKKLGGGKGNELES